jgi:hypothetical protein
MINDWNSCESKGFDLIGFCEGFLTAHGKFRDKKLEILKNSPDLDNENSHKN